MTNPVDDARTSLSNVAQSAVLLAKAELGVVSLEARKWVGRVVLPLLLAALGALFLNAAILLAVFSPILLHWVAADSLAIASACALVPCVLLLVAAWRGFARLTPAPSEARLASVPTTPNQVEGRGAPVADQRR